MRNTSVLPHRSRCRDLVRHCQPVPRRRCRPVDRRVHQSAERSRSLQRGPVRRRTLDPRRPRRPSTIWVSFDATRGAETTGCQMNPRPDCLRNQQRHRHPRRFPGDISTTQTRDVTGYEVRSNMQGDFVCHFGTSSGFSCGTVVSTTHDPGYDVCGWWLGCDNRWVKVEGSTLKSCGGDSGGPWFQDRIAYGVHSGSSGSDCTAAGTDYATFTAMDDVLRDLDLDLALT